MEVSLKLWLINQISFIILVDKFIWSKVCDLHLYFDDIFVIHGIYYIDFF